MSKKTTRKALLGSVLALVLCVAMLVGTTFAWFTDSVTSGQNTIQSGNLDVELWYSKDLTDWNEVESDTKVFNENALYEPGYTEVVYLKVKNAGSLALKFMLNADVYKETEGTNVDNKTFLLSDYLKYGTVPTTSIIGRDAAMAAASTYFGAEPVKNILEAGKEAVYAMVIAMPTSIGNEANHKTGTAAPTITLGVNLVAAQATVEEDSFDKLYDENAPYYYGKTNLGPYNLSVLSNGIAAYDVDTNTYTVNVDSVAQGGYNATQGGNFFAGYTVNVAGYGANATVSFDKADGSGVTIWKLADEERDGFINNGVHQQWTRVGRKTAYRYDIDGDGVTDFTVVNDVSNAGVEVANADELKKVLEAGSVATLTADIALNDAITVPAGVTAKLDLNGYVLSGTCNVGQGYMIMVNNGATLNIKDGSSAQTGKITYAQGSSNTGWAIDLEGELNLYSGTIELTGESWSIGYAVDVRPNAWGTNYTEDTVFHMYGGNVISSDGAIRVASSSSDTYGNIVASFIMDGGEIDADWDGIFVQQSNAAYDTLNVTINSGVVKSALSPIRVYGPDATSVNAGTEKPITITIDGGDLSVKGTPDETRVWHTPGKIVIGGGMSLNNLNQYATITIS